MRNALIPKNEYKTPKNSEWLAMQPALNFSYLKNSEDEK